MIRPDPALPPKDQDPVVLLALTVLGEARNQTYQGKCAVAQVVKNRMDAKPSLSVADTVLAPWQFSCWNPGDPNKQFLEEVIAKQAGNVQPGLWEEVIQAAEGALGSPREVDPTGGSTHYVVAELWAQATKAKKPAWYTKPCVDKGVTQWMIQIGAHVFAKTPW